MQVTCVGLGLSYLCLNFSSIWFLKFSTTSTDTTYLPMYTLHVSHLLVLCSNMNETVKDTMKMLPENLLKHFQSIATWHFNIF